METPEDSQPPVDRLVMLHVTVYSRDKQHWLNLKKAAPDLPLGVVWAKGCCFFDGEDGDYIAVDTVAIGNDGQVHVHLEDVYESRFKDDVLRMWSEFGWSK